MTEELVPLLGEIRDQLKRIADYLERDPVNVDAGEPTIRLRERDIQKITNAIRGYVDK